MIGGGLRVPKDVPPYVLGGQEPLIFQGLNSVGLRRRGFSAEAIDALGRAYALIYNAGLNVSQAVARIKSDAGLMQHKEVLNVLEFVAASERGIIGGPRKRR